VYRLTREVRFAVTEAGPDSALNGHGGVPAVSAIGPWLALRITLTGALDPSSSYLRNIKQIDQVARERAVPILLSSYRDPHQSSRLGCIPAEVVRALGGAWPGVALERLEIAFSPFCSIAAVTKELPMTRLSQKFEFSAAHRLHNPNLSDAENVRTYGKCNNPHGHGHNYEVQVTVRGQPNPAGVVIAVSELERIVHETVIQKLDHKHLNLEVPEFHSVIPSVENIAAVIFQLLKPKTAAAGAALASVTVWETPKTWCEYSE